MVPYNNSSLLTGCCQQSRLLCQENRPKVVQTGDTVGRPAKAVCARQEETWAGPPRCLKLFRSCAPVARPVTAEQPSDWPEVSPRTIYRDIATLQSMRMPVEGAAGLGYILRQSYDLPPLNFDSEEIEALQVGLLM